MAKPKKSGFVDKHAEDAGTPRVKLVEDLDDVPEGADDVELGADDSSDPWNDDEIAPPPPEVVAAAAGADLEDGEYVFGAPPRQYGFRVCTRPEWNTPGVLMTLEVGGEKTHFFVGNRIGAEAVEKYTGMARYVTLIWWQNTQGTQGLWWINPNETNNTWQKTAQKAVDYARTRWVRVTPNNARGNYKIQEVPLAPPEPVWPEMSRLEVLKAAFGKRIITRLDDPALAGLGGKVLE